MTRRPEAARHTSSCDKCAGSIPTSGSIFRSPDLSGWAKAFWFLFVLFIPLIGVLVYLIARGGAMHERSVW
jgi:hypothetical protein